MAANLGNKPWHALFEQQNERPSITIELHVLVRSITTGNVDDHLINRPTFFRAKNRAQQRLHSLASRRDAKPPPHPPVGPLTIMENTVRQVPQPQPLYCSTSYSPPTEPMDANVRATTVPTSIRCRMPLLHHTVSYRQCVRRRAIAQCVMWVKPDQPWPKLGVKTVPENQSAAVSSGKTPPTQPEKVGVPEPSLPKGHGIYLCGFCGPHQPAFVSPRRILEDRRARMRRETPEWPALFRAVMWGLGIEWGIAGLYEASPAASMAQAQRPVAFWLSIRFPCSTAVFRLRATANIKLMTDEQQALFPEGPGTFWGWPVAPRPTYTGGPFHRRAKSRRLIHTRPFDPARGSGVSPCGFIIFFAGWRRQL